MELGWWRRLDEWVGVVEGVCIVIGRDASKTIQLSASRLASILMSSSKNFMEWLRTRLLSRRGVLISWSRSRYNRCSRSGVPGRTPVA